MGAYNSFERIAIEQVIRRLIRRLIKTQTLGQRTTVLNKVQTSDEFIYLLLDARRNTNILQHRLSEQVLTTSLYRKRQKG